MKTQEEIEAEAAAAAKLKADADAKAAQEAGKAGGADDENLSPEDMKKIIKDLRKENAGHRTKGKSQEDAFKKLNDELGGIKKHLGIKEDQDPAEQLKELTSKSEALEFELSMQQLARANGIPVEHDDYFRFMIGKKIAAIEAEGKEGDELSEQAITEVVTEVQKYTGFKATKPNGNSSGVDDNVKPPAGGGKEAMTPEAFAKLSMAEKSKLYVDNKPEYDRLLASAKNKRLL